MKIRIVFAAAALGGLVVAGTTAVASSPQLATAPVFRSWGHKVTAAETTWALVASGIARETASGTLTAAQATAFGQALRRATGTQPATPHVGEVIDYDPADIPVVAPGPTTTAAGATTTTRAPTPATTTTTTLAPTTTAATTTTVAATTTTVRPPTPTTTTVPPAPPAGVAFSATFDTPADFYDRFDMGLSGFHPTVDPNHIREWQGDHNMACGLPDTQRTVHLGENRADVDELFWWCAPAGAETGHLMTSLDTLGYNILWFSPKPWFTNVSRVCWDQNTTMMGGRKWTQVVLAGRADVEREQARVGRLDLGFSHPGFQLVGGPTTEIIPTDATVGFNFLIGLLTFWQGNHEIGQAGDLWKSEDVSTRYRMCVKDNGNNTVTMTQARPAGVVKTATYAGSFPNGEVRVAFHDANYDPPKDAEYSASQNTWHWDNIVVETG